MIKLWLFFVILCLQISIFLFFQNHITNLSLFDSDSDEFCDDSLSNLTVFESILQQPKCDSSKFDFIVLIHSAVNNYKNREILRKQAKFHPKFQFVFVLGISDLKESDSIGDVLQGDFVDSYRNLTRKHLFGLSWAINCYSDQQWILKIDDDIFVNFKMIQKHFERLRKRQTLKKHYILGHVHDKMKVIRQQKSKWFVNKEEFEHDYYPEFVSGWAYLTRISTANILLNRAKKYDKNFFWIDDVYITGILRQITCIKLFAINHLLNVDITRLVQWLRGDKITFAVFFSNTNGDLKLLESAFKQINN